MKFNSDHFRSISVEKYFGCLPIKNFNPKCKGNSDFLGRIEWRIRKETPFDSTRFFGAIRKNDS